MSDYIYRININDRDGNTIGCKEIVVPNDVVEKIRAEVIDELTVYILNSCKDVKCKEDITSDNDFDFYASELLEIFEEFKKPVKGAEK